MLGCSIHQTRRCRLLADQPSCCAQTLLLLHAGVDPTTEQWRELSKLLKEKTLLPILDCAYQVRLCACCLLVAATVLPAACW